MKTRLFLISSALYVLSAGLAGAAATFNQFSYQPGELITVTADIISGQDIPSGLVDFELWKNGEKISQVLVSQSLVAGVAKDVETTIFAPAPGSYILKIGVFVDDWSAIYQWNDNAGTVVVSDTLAEPIHIDSFIAADKFAYDPGDPIHLIIHMQADKAFTGKVFAELQGLSGKIAEYSAPADFMPNTRVSLPWDISGLPLGIYTIKISILSPDLSQIYYQNDQAYNLRVLRSRPTAAPVYAISASLPQIVFDPGTAATITTNVTSNGDSPNLVIDTEIYNEANVKVEQNVVEANLWPNRQFSSNWNPVLPAVPGKYTVKVGIFSNDWSKMYDWKDNLSQFYIGALPGGPEVGQTYAIKPIEPQDGSIVFGLVEVKASISELDINTYNIGWRTEETGNFFLFDIEPITKNFKHAWIDFSPWNWMPDNIYPLEFQATNLAGNVIGYKIIHVRVVH